MQTKQERLYHSSYQDIFNSQSHQSSGDWQGERIGSHTNSQGLKWKRRMADDKDMFYK